MAPLWQGAEQHSLTSTSQNSPMKPGGQLRKHIMLSNSEAVSELSLPSCWYDTLHPTTSLFLKKIVLSLCESAAASYFKLSYVYIGHKLKKSPFKTDESRSTDSWNQINTTL